MITEVRTIKYKKKDEERNDNAEKNKSNRHADVDFRKEIQSRGNVKAEELLSLEAKDFLVHHKLLFGESSIQEREDNINLQNLSSLCALSSDLVEEEVVVYILQNVASKFMLFQARFPQLPHDFLNQLLCRGHAWIVLKCCFQHIASYAQQQNSNSTQQKLSLDSLQCALRFLRSTIKKALPTSNKFWRTPDISNHDDGDDNINDKKQRNQSKDIAIAMSNLLIRFPPMIANAHHAQSLVLPQWATRNIFWSGWVQQLLITVWENNQKEADIVSETREMKNKTVSQSISLLQCFVTHLARNGSYETIVQGTFQAKSNVMSKVPREQTSLVDIVSSILTSLEGKNDRALIYILRSFIRCAFVYPKTTKTNIWAVDFSRQICTSCLLFCTRLREQWVHLMVLNTSSVQHDFDMDRRQIELIIDVLKAMTKSNAQMSSSEKNKNYKIVEVEDDASSSSSEEGSIEEQRNEKMATTLEGFLAQIIGIWSEFVFIQQTDERLQRHVTGFILQALRELEKNCVSVTTPWVSLLVEGVTGRLESSLPSIRADGMRVAQTLARCLGQPPPEFQELQEYDEEEQQERAKRKEKEKEETNVIESETAGTKKNKKRQGHRVVDPDAEYHSSNDEESLSSSSSVEWDDDDSLVPYDLKDDEEDLRPVRAPLYLRECLELLSTPETDSPGMESYAHEAALKAVEHLVLPSHGNLQQGEQRQRPLDLEDVAIPLATKLLIMENKYNIPNYVTMRERGIWALVIQEPLLVGEYLIRQVLYSEGFGLEARIDCLRALEETSYELCGIRQWERQNENKTSPEKLGAVLPSSLTSEELVGHSTRRWRKRKPACRSFQNEFLPIAPVWFYSIVEGFLQHKTETRLWAGANGGRLLTRILTTLSTIVECASTINTTMRHASLGQDLVEFAWSLRETQVAELRAASLLALAQGLDAIGEDAMTLLAYSSSSSLSFLPNFLLQTVQQDPDDTCRELAMAIVKNIRNTASNILLATNEHSSSAGDDDISIRESKRFHQNKT